MEHNTSPLTLGTLVQLKCECLYNPAGTVGVVYEVYERRTAHKNDKDRYGISVIFPNGRHDGFSPYERQTFLTVVGLATDCAVRTYKFKHVSQLARDFELGLFAQAFREGLLLKTGTS